MSRFEGSRIELSFAASTMPCALKVTVLVKRPSRKSAVEHLEQTKCGDLTDDTVCSMVDVFAIRLVDVEIDNVMHHEVLRVAHL